MKIGAIKLSSASIALLVIQLSLVCSVAAKYLYQRWTCPRVWTRSVAYDPALLMRGRYLSLQLTVDGCQSTLPSGKRAEFPRDYNGAAVPGSFRVLGEGDIAFPATLKVENQKLSAIYVRDAEQAPSGQMVFANAEWPCDQMRLSAPVYFYISEHARSPLPLAAGSELWVEVTVPPKGPPRPIQLALKRDGGWQPLAFQ
ncbi:MAG TPA: hypothetical protein VLT57_15755 [Bryobacteraceae bacterium]|nr:hypothetical protein [Bryobacteraceae bacterium]